MEERVSMPLGEEEIKKKLKAAGLSTYTSENDLSPWGWAMSNDERSACTKKRLKKCHVRSDDENVDNIFSEKPKMEMMVTLFNDSMGRHMSEVVAQFGFDLTEFVEEHAYEIVKKEAPKSISRLGSKKAKCFVQDVMFDFAGLEKLVKNYIIYELGWKHLVKVRFFIAGLEVSLKPATKLTHRSLFIKLAFPMIVSPANKYQALYRIHGTPLQVFYEIYSPIGEQVSTLMKLKM